MSYNYIDMAQTDDGDIIIGPPKYVNGIVLEDGREVRDLALTSGPDAIIQASGFRLMTEQGDMFLHVELGTIFQEIVGQRNTKDTMEMGKTSIINALTYGGFIMPKDILVTGIPIDEQNIIYHIEVSSGNYIVLKLDLLCDLENGIRRI